MTDFYEGADKFLAERKVKQDALMEQAKAVVDANPSAHIHKRRVVRVRRVVLNPTPDKKLILKDGNFQLVREYQRNGDNVRYFSEERHVWEEIPIDTVDWGAIDQTAIDDEPKEVWVKEYASGKYWNVVS